MESLQVVRDLILIIGTCIAVYGIDSWRREHRGRRQLELAEEVLASFYEARDVIKYMRHPFSFVSETDDVERAVNESDDAYDARRNASIVFKRYNQYSDLFSKIHASRYRFMALMGKDEAKPFDKLRKIVNEILTAARILSRLWPRDYFTTVEHQERHQKLIDDNEAIFWEGLKDPDPINSRLDDVVAQIEATCRNILSGKGTLHYFINLPVFKKR